MTNLSSESETVSMLPARSLKPVAVGIDSRYLSIFVNGVGIDWDALRFERENLHAAPELTSRSLIWTEKSSRLGRSNLFYVV